MANNAFVQIVHGEQIWEAHAFSAWEKGQRHSGRVDKQMFIGFYADLQLQRARCRGDIKASLVPGCDGEDLVPSHEPNPRTKVLHHGNNVSLLGKSKQVGLLSLVELESIHSWALSEDQYEL